jgi:peptidoglycan/xylan/chitin deacetylase (PgdA/CDA1 family)
MACPTDRRQANQIEVIEPISEPISEPVSEPVSELISEPISEPVFEPIVYASTTKKYQLSCNCVSFRLDGVQDYWLNDVQFELINLFSKNHIPLTVGIIIDSFGNDPYLVDLVKNEIKYNNLEIANHGLDSTPFTVFDKQKQNSMLKESTNKFYEKLNVSPKIFIPPENRFNEDTKKVLIENGFTHLSASMLNDSPPFLLEDESLYRFPEIASTGGYVPSQNRILGISSDKTFSDAMEGIKKYGFAVITLHPQEFSIFKGGKYLNELNLNQIKELETLLEEIKSQNIDVVHLGQIDQRIIKVMISEKSKNPLEPYDIPVWVKNNAGWWRDGHIDDNTFVQGIQFLIKEGIMQIPQTTQGSGGSEIPDWIKDNAGWWAEGKISDDDFIYG